MTLDLTSETEGLPRVGGHDVAVQIRCDRCQEPLRPEAGGRVLWERDPDEPYLDVAYLHHDCVEGHEREVGKELEGAELGPFLAALVHNLEVAG